MSTAISVSGLRKSFGSTVALDGLDLEVQTGQVHGFLGPNGAGKSTTIRILLGLVRADAGSVTLLGGDPWHDVETLHRRLAYVPGDVTLWPNLTGGEVIDLLVAYAAISTSVVETHSSNGSSWTPPRRGAPTPRATDRRSPSSPRSRPTSSCSFSMSRRPGWTR